MSTSKGLDKVTDKVDKVSEKVSDKALDLSSDKADDKDLSKDSRPEAADPCSAPEHSKSKLLRAAFDIFSKQGFHGATTKLIAQTAQVNEALIMRHFKSKEGLFLAVIENNLACENEDLPYPVQATAEEEFIQFCDFIYERDEKKSDFLRILIAHSLQDKAFVCRADEQVMSKKKPMLHERIEALQAKGQLRKELDPETIEASLRNQAFAANFFRSLICVYEEEETRANLHATVRALAKGFA